MNTQIHTENTTNLCTCTHEQKRTWKYVKRQTHEQKQMYKDTNKYTQKLMNENKTHRQRHTHVKSTNVLIRTNKLGNM